MAMLFVWEDIGSRALDFLLDIPWVLSISHWFDTP
jgi:hypothetical protein